MTNSKRAGKPAKSETVGKQAATPPSDPKALPIEVEDADDFPREIAKACTRPSINAAIVVDAFQSNILGKGVNLSELVDDLETKAKEVTDGNLSMMEAMLVGQATALQTMFTHLARRASNQEHMSQYQAFMSLAFKAQAQSRATISTLIDLKYPKQAATFVRQANISSGHQQINNRAMSEQYAHAHAQAGNAQSEPNKLLEVRHGQRLDIGAQGETGTVNQGLEAVGAIHRGEDRAR